MITVFRYSIHRVQADGRSVSDGAVNPGSEDLGEAKDIVASITRSDRGQPYAIRDNGDHGVIIGQYVGSHALPFHVEVRVDHRGVWIDDENIDFDTLEEALRRAKDLDRLETVVAWRVRDNANVTHWLEGTFIE